MKGANHGIESGHEGVRRGLAASVRYHHLSHNVTNINVDVFPNLLVYNEIEVALDAKVRLRRHEFLRGRASDPRRAAKYKLTFWHFAMMIPTLFMVCSTSRLEWSCGSSGLVPSSPLSLAQPLNIVLWNLQSA